MVVRDDDVHILCCRRGDCVCAADSAVHRDDQINRLIRSHLYMGRKQAVSFLDAVGNIPGDPRVYPGQKFKNQCGGGHTVCIKVTEYQDFFLVYHSRIDPFHSFLHPFHGIRVGQAGKIRVQEKPGGFHRGKSPVPDQAGGHRMASQRLCEQTDPVRVGFSICDFRVHGHLMDFI